MCPRSAAKCSAVRPSSSLADSGGAVSELKFAVTAAESALATSIASPSPDNSWILLLSAASKVKRAKRFASNRSETTEGIAAGFEFESGTSGRLKTDPKLRPPALPFLDPFSAPIAPISSIFASPSFSIPFLSSLSASSPPPVVPRSPSSGTPRVFSLAARASRIARPFSSASCHSFSSSSDKWARSISSSSSSASSSSASLSSLAAAEAVRSAMRSNVDLNSGARASTTEIYWAIASS
mmetsp:Transcript_13385/g.23713  ORF Transcript_13385/g.23713 Transcript_13385/m.23713 type:complete len:239 (-) Transcript_13385:360-1076(-)